MDKQTENPFSHISDQTNQLKIVPLGGCGEFGMNMTAYLFQKKCLIVDCGIMFPDARKLGINAILPDVDPWFEECGGVFAYIITHGHEDHIGALPYIYPKWPAPIYATPWTAELIKTKFEIKTDLSKDDLDLRIVKAGEKIDVGGINWHYVHVNHSIPDACCLFIKAGPHHVFHSGDFKWDREPIDEKEMDFEAIAEASKTPLDLAFTDSTNAFKEGFCPGEKSTIAPLKKLIEEAKGAAYVTTFSSNFRRLKTVAEICRELNKSLYIDSRSMQTTFQIADKLKRMEWPDDVIIDDAALPFIPRDKLVVLVSGCQAEFRSSLVRVAYEEHKRLHIEPGDRVIFSSRVIPGNEKVILQMISQLEKRGAEVITAKEKSDIHVSGHAYSGELEKLVKTLNPAHYVPIHGSHSHLLSNKTNVGDPFGRSYKIENGTVISLTDHKLEINSAIEVNWSFIDDYSNFPLSYGSMRDRHRIGELGLAVFSGVFCKKKRDFLRDPRLDFFGLELPDHTDSQKWLDSCRLMVSTQLSSWEGLKFSSEAEANEFLRVVLRRHLEATFSKRPVVITTLNFNES